MQEIVAPVNHIKFDIELALEQQLGSQPLPFPGMDSKFVTLSHTRTHTHSVSHDSDILTYIYRYRYFS